MKQKYIIFLLVLCTHIAARGQTGFGYEYWFDNDRSTLQSGTSENQAFGLQADVGELSSSLHTIHIQVRDGDGNLSAPVSRQFLKLTSKETRQLVYWFDDNDSHAVTTVAQQGVSSIDVSSLPEGFHTLRYRVQDGQSPSTTVSRSFLKTIVADGTQWHCWFDDDRSTMQSGTDVNGTIVLDVSQLEDGFHQLHVQVEGRGNAVSTTTTHGFVKIPQVKGVDYLTCLCMVDGELFRQEEVSANNDLLHWDFDVSALPQGLHHVRIQVVSPSGVASTSYQSFFMRVPMSAELAGMKCIYAIDGSEFYTEAGQMVDGTFHFDLDVASLEDGLHHISYMLSNGRGVHTVAKTQFFVKTPIGGNGISEYWYWLNEQSESQAQKIRLCERRNPFELISLLPVESQPIRSSCFAFRMENGHPVIYAKNDIHLRFIDAAGRAADIAKQYVDESVRESVVDITPLNAGDNKTMTTPVENEIRWYKVVALRGDSLAFKTDSPCTIQLFSPTGEELYVASGSNAVCFGGAYAPEDGEYYLALHDVTARNCSNLSVAYQHIDKYAVLEYSPNELGVLPCAQVVSVSGNGFDKLKSAALRSQEREIVAESVLVYNKSDADLVFVLQGDEEKTAYDLVLTFEDDGIEEELVVEAAVSLAEPDYADFTIEITDPRTVASPYPVSVTITNNGNLTYSNIPFYMAYDNVERITDMRFLNFDIEADSVLIDEGLQFVYDIENFKEKGVKAKVIPAFIPILQPGETIVLKLGFQASSHTIYNVYAWAGTPWSLYYQETMTAIQQKSQGAILPGSGDGTSGNINGGVTTSCMPDPCDIAGNQLAECLCGITVGNGLVIGGIELALINRDNAAQREQLDNNFMSASDYEIFRSYPLPHPGQVVRNTAGHCAAGKVGKIVNATNTMIDMVSDDPCLMPVQHTCNQFNPGDPNDIIGYMAQSGSKYMTEGTTDVYFTIEFENNPEIANASAHTIVVTDTLDATRFDLSTFAAKRIKIGNKEMTLVGEKNFSKRTMDLRPEINVIAQVSLSFNEQKGIAQWLIESLDPMSMEPTMDAMQGVLPVNANGNGQGELAFDISLKPGLKEGESVSNRAGIVFDQEEIIMTPTWTNIVDGTLPESRVTDVEMLTDTTAIINIEVADEMSKPWQYDLYVQEDGDGTWIRRAVNVPVDSVLQVTVADGISYGFYVVATDSAGNVEVKDAAREFTLRVGLTPGDANNDGVVNIADVTAVINQINGVQAAAFRRKNADINDDGNINIADVTGIINIINK